MNLHEKWKNLAELKRTEQEYNAYWQNYWQTEKGAYQKLLEKKPDQVMGQVVVLAEEYEMDTVVFIGFLDGINTSLKTQIDLDALEENSEISFEVEYEKLYYNMLVAKADWLYSLSQWDDILSEEDRKEIKKKFNKDHIATSNKVGRNEPCPCGSGKKHKKCCLVSE